MQVKYKTNKKFSWRGEVEEPAEIVGKLQLL